MKHAADAGSPHTPPIWPGFFEGHAAVAVLGAVMLAALAGCTEDVLTGVEEEDRPGSTVETVEVVLEADELPLWRDTTYTGFRIPSDAPFALVSDSTAVQARALARFGDIPESVTPDGGEETPVEAFTAASVQLTVDTLRSSAPETGFTVRIFSLARPYEEEAADWTSATEAETWGTPGGDLDRELGSLVVDDSVSEALSDGLEIPIDAPDSVLTSWRESGGEPGFAILVEGASTLLQVVAIDLEADATVEDEEDPVSVSRSAGKATFLFDPETPPTGESLRLGGLPASRVFVTFRPPDSAAEADVSLRDAQINRAELVLRPLEPPAPAFRTDSVLTARVVELLADPMELGPRTPVGREINQFSVDFGAPVGEEPLRIPITRRLQAWASGDTVQTLRFVIHLQGEGGSLVFREFGSVEAAVGSRPLLRLLVTPAASFDL